MLSAILNRLTSTATGFEVIAAAPSGAAITTLDAAAASAALKALLVAAVTHAYPVDIPEGKTPTDAAYRLVSARPVDVDGVRVLTAVTFVVTVRAKSYTDLMAALSAVETQVAASDDAISILDAILDFDAQKNYYFAALELQYAVPAVTALAAPHWPAVLVDIDSISGAPSVYDNHTKQRIQRSYSFTLLSATDNIATLRASLQSALLGWQQNQEDSEFEFAAGSAITVPGGLYGWRDTYTDSGHIEQQ